VCVGVILSVEGDVFSSLSTVGTPGWKVGSKDAHRRFGRKGVEGCACNDTGYWQRLRDGVEGEIG